MSRTALKARLTILTIAVCGTFADAGAQERERDPETRALWTRYFHDQRANASGQIPSNSGLNGWRAVNALPTASFAGAADAAWRPLGPAGLFSSQTSSAVSPFGGQMQAGRVTAIAIHPNDSRTIFVGSASGGVWKSTNGGYSWTPLSDTQCSLAIGALAVDPANPNLIYAGTGEINTALSAGCGILKSTDGGQSWTSQPTNPVGPFHGGLVVDRVTAGSATLTTLLSATSGGLYRSTNSGQNWTRKITGVAWTVVAHPSRPGTFYASVTSTLRTPVTTVWKSTDGGDNWTALPTPLVSSTQIARVALAISRADPDMVFALAADFTTRQFAGLFRWNDATQTWSTLPATGIVTSMTAFPFTFGEQGEYNLVVAVDPRNANRIWAAGVGAFASEDGGQTFRSTARNVHVDWHAITFDTNDPDHMLAGTDGGVFASFDAGRSWFAQNNGLAIAQFYQGVSVHPSGLWVYGGLQDNNAVYFTGSPVWHNLSALGDGGSTVVKPSDPSTVYVTHAFLNAIRRITRFGEAPRDFGIGTQDRFGNPRPLVIDPVNNSILYFGTHRLYRTTDEGANWLPITADLTRGSGFITTIAIAPSNSQTIYVGTSDGVIAVSLDGGATFNRFVFTVLRWFTEIAVNPTDPLHAIATSSTLGVVHVIETRNAGASFSGTIGTPLPDIPVHSALFVPGTSTFMIGTEYGVLQTTNGGAQWTQGPPGLPNTIVYDLAYAPISGTVFASTHGRGVFAFRPGATPAVLRGDVDGDGRVTAQDALLVQQSLVGMELPPGRSVFPQGDANCDGRLQGIDVLLVLRASVGLPNVGACVGTMFHLQPA